MCVCVYILCFCLRAIPSTALGLAIPGLALKDYSWKCSGDLYRLSGIQPRLTMCKTSALPSVLYFYFLPCEARLHSM